MGETATRRRPGRAGRAAAVAAALVATLGIGALILVNAAGSPAPSSASASSETPSSVEPPPGGITPEMAIEIATGRSAWDRPSDFSVDASASFDEGRGRWVWGVSWERYGGPTGSEGCEVVIDYLSGELLHQQCWVS
jgi:hypothetical protein